jgi:hypothetical protein
MYNNQRAKFEKNLIIKARYIANYIYYSKKGKMKLIKNSKNKLLCIILFPLGYLLSLKRFIYKKLFYKKINNK